MTAARPDSPDAPDSPDGARTDRIDAPPRFAVLRGVPTVEELAAIAVVIADADDREAARRTGSRRPGWQEAARLEGLGIGELAAPGHLVAARRFQG